MPDWRRLLREPARPDAIRSRPNAHWFAVATVCIGAFMGQLDASIVTLAFPALEEEFGAGIGAVTWVGLTYLLVLVGLVAPIGRLADMAGRKLLYTYGFAVFIVGSALCGLAPNLLMLNVFRAVQAIGAAMLQANSVAIIYAAMPRDKLGRGIGIQGAAQALGLALGPTVGGLLVQAGGWRWIFWVNVPMGIAGVVLGWFFIPRSRNLVGRSRFDWIGLALFFPAVAALLAAISLGNDVGWTSPWILALFVFAALALVAFLLRERAAASPMLPLALFRRLPFTAGIGSGLLSYLVMFGTLFVVPFYLQRALGVGPGRSGLILTVMPVVLGVLAPFAGRWADRVGPRPLTVSGMAVSAAALAGLALLESDMTLLVAGLVLLGVGMGLFTPPNNAAIMAAAPGDQSGVAAGVLNMTRGVGTALGLAATGLVFAAVAGEDASAADLVTHGFSAAAWFLAAVAAVAAVLAALRGRGRLVSR
jgi:EmrB/QacA subfamily drug resistance transporter